MKIMKSQSLLLTWRIHCFPTSNLRRLPAISALVAFAATALLCLVATNVRGATLTAGGGIAPLGADDWDVTYQVSGLRSASSWFVEGGTQLVGKNATVTENPPPSSALYQATVTGTFPAASGTAPVSWYIKTKPPWLAGGSTFSVASWTWTTKGAPTGTPYTTPTGSYTVDADNIQHLKFDLPYDVATMTISDFQVYANQDSSIDPMTFLDFSSDVFTGLPVSGIPSTFSLDTANPFIDISSQVHPDLQTAAGMAFGWEFTTPDGAEYRGLIDVVPEPKSLAMSFIIAVSGLVYARCRRRLGSR